MNPEPRPWDRQPGEGPRAFQAFRIYLELGPARSIAKAVEEYQRQNNGKTAGAARTIRRRWQTWSAEHRWQERARAFDVEEYEQRTEAVLHRRREMALRRADLETELQARIEARLTAVEAKLDALLKLPSTDVEQSKYDADGTTVSRQRVRGLRPSELAKLSAEWRELAAAGVHGFVRISRSERLESAGNKNAGDGGAPVHLELVLDEWPDGGNPERSV
jgi:hypothetical protein